MGRIEQHLEWCARRNLRPNYITEVRSTLRRLDKLFGPLEDATEDQVEAWWASLNVGPGARIAYAAHLSGFYRWLIYSRLRNDDPTGRLIRPRSQTWTPPPHRRRCALQSPGGRRTARQIVAGTRRLRRVPGV